MESPNEAPTRTKYYPPSQIRLIEWYWARPSVYLCRHLLVAFQVRHYRLLARHIT